jgi:hypothetical protein
MLDEGIRVTVDLIVGLPGDTIESVRKGFDYPDPHGWWEGMRVPARRASQEEARAAERRTSASHNGYEMRLSGASALAARLPGGARR